MNGSGAPPMADTFTQSLELTVEGQAPDTFTVARMTGREAISELFRFEVDVVSASSGIALETLAGESATLAVTRLGRTRTIHGMLQGIELTGRTAGGDTARYVYRAVLVPRLQRLALGRHNRVHGADAAVTVKDILAARLKDAGFKGAAASGGTGSSLGGSRTDSSAGPSDFSLRLTRTYPERDYVVQYDESDLAFISRLCEHYGIFYFFVHTGGRDVAMFGDSRTLFPAVSGSGSIGYRPASGLANASEASVFAFSGRSRVVPRTVRLTDYDYRTPDVALKVEQTVDPNGRGTVVDHGSHFRTAEEGRSLALVRAQELAGRKLSFKGRSDSVDLAAGAMFTLAGHFRDDFDAEYLVTWIEHEATQALAGIAEFSGSGHETSYRNRFGCLPKTAGGAPVEFRPARNTPKPRMAGLSSAVIDSAGSGRRADLDATGRYRIRQKFDQSDAAAGQASGPVRLAAPYGGLHYPLLKGTEVIVSCVDGNPDRPVIVGAVPNTSHPSVVNSTSHTRNRIRTTAGTLFEIDDGPAGTPPESSTVRLNVPAPVESYWRVGSAAASGDTIETGARKPNMTTLDGDEPAGGDGILEYTAGSRSSLIGRSLYIQTSKDKVESAEKHFLVSHTDFTALAQRLHLHASHSTLDETSRAETSAEAVQGDIYLTADRNIVYTAGGNLESRVAGHQHTAVSQSSTDITKGASFSQTWGADAEMMLGPTLSMTFGAALEMDLNLSVSIAAGMSLSLFMGLNYEVRVGPGFELNTSPTVEINSIQDLRVIEREVVSKTMQVGIFPAQLVASIYEMRQKAASATTSGTDVTVTGNKTVI